MKIKLTPKLIVSLVYNLYSWLYFPNVFYNENLKYKIDRNSQSTQSTVSNPKVYLRLPAAGAEQHIFIG